MIIEGKKIKDKILDELREEVCRLSVKPKLVVIQVGDNDNSAVYTKQKANMCNYVGYEYEHIKLDESVDVDSVLEVIDKLNKDDSVNGILVQLPLPNKMNMDKVVNAISSVKDVDGLTDLNKGKLFSGKDTLYSCTPYGVMELLFRYNIPVSGKHVVIVGRSDLVGKSMAMMMLSQDATVTICHSKTKNLSEYTRKADILVVAVGIPKFITSEMVSEDTIVIDVGINITSNGLCGDVDFDLVKDKVKYITPVPFGVGQMTVAMLAKNILKAYKMQNDKRI